MALRQIIEIDESRCDGCGKCILDCAEGALAIVNGKAKVIADVLCDGLGACLSGCPQDALKIITRDAPDFDEAAVHAHLNKESHSGCAGKRVESFASLQARGPVGLNGNNEPDGHDRHGEPVTPELGMVSSSQQGPVLHWPMKLRLVPATAPFLCGAKVSLVADCAAPASVGFHKAMEGRVVLIACPKFEDKAAILEKLFHVFTESGIAELEIVHMEVPCCSPLAALCKESAAKAGFTGRVAIRSMRRDGSFMQALC